MAEGGKDFDGLQIEKIKNLRVNLDQAPLIFISIKFEMSGVWDNEISCVAVEQYRSCILTRNTRLTRVQFPYITRAKHAYCMSLHEFACKPQSACNFATSCVPIHALTRFIFTNYTRLTRVLVRQ